MLLYIRTGWIYRPIGLCLVPRSGKFPACSAATLHLETVAVYRCESDAEEDALLQAIP